MGSYGIGPGRVLAAAVEQHGGDEGIVWPAEIAPYDVHVVVLGWDNPELVAIGEQVAESLSAEGLDVLLDDRELRPGEKFADADLIGCPLRVTVGKKTLEDGAVDLRDRTSGDESRVAGLEIAKRVLGKLMPRKRKYSDEEFGATIERLMADTGLTYRGLAAKTGLSAGYLNHLVHGNRPVPSKDVVVTARRRPRRRAGALSRVSPAGHRRPARRDARARRPPLPETRRLAGKATPRRTTLRVVVLAPLPLALSLEGGSRLLLDALVLPDVPPVHERGGRETHGSHPEWGRCEQHRHPGSGKDEDRLFHPP